MSILSTTRGSPRRRRSTVFGRIAMAIVIPLLARQRARATEASLQSLDDVLLADIGLRREQIRPVARDVSHLRWPR